MNQQEFEHQTNKTIAKFKSGIERYQKSTTFNIVVRQLVNGVDPYEIIDQLCEMSDAQQKAFEEFVTKSTQPLFIIKEQHAG